MSQTVLVTGGAGFIGSHVVDALLAAGDRVIVVDDLVPQVHGKDVERPRYLSPEAQFIRADLCDSAKWSWVLSDVDSVIHLAAEVGVGQSMYEIVRYVRGNTLATAVLLECLLPHRDHIRKLVVASSMSIYGEGAYATPDGHVFYPRLRPLAQLERQEWEMRDPESGVVADPIPTDEEKPLYPTSIYAITKRDHEEMLLTFGQAYHIPAIALRFFNVYGPRQALSNPYTGVAAIFSARLLNQKSPLIFEDGRQSRDFVHVSDIVQGILLALAAQDVSETVFNIGTGRQLSVLEVARRIAYEMGVDIEPEIVHQYRAGDIRHCFADISRIRRVLGYEPRVPFENGLRELIAANAGGSAADLVESAYHELAAHGLTR